MVKKGHECMGCSPEVTYTLHGGTKVVFCAGFYFNNHYDLPLCMSTPTNMCGMMIRCGTIEVSNVKMIFKRIFQKEISNIRIVSTFIFVTLKMDSKTVQNVANKK